MPMFENLPAKFPVSNLAKFNFGTPEGKDDPLLEACALRIAPIAEFLEENKSILVGDRGTGKTAVFRLLAEGKLSFNNPENFKQIYIPIDEELGYKTLKEHVTSKIKSPLNTKDAPHRIVWELFLLSRCIEELRSDFGRTQEFKDIEEGFYKALGWQSNKKASLLDVLTQTKKTFGVKLEGGNMGYVVPDFYTSLEPARSEGEGLDSANFLDLQRYKKDINSILSSSKTVVYLLVDKLDEFVSGSDYETQMDMLQALMLCWRDYQSESPRVS